MEDKFTKLNLNGVEKQVAAIYDGSGNDIVNTYETKIDATSKKDALNSLITTANEAIEALTARVVITEGFSASIQKNTQDIQTNLTAIQALQQANTTFQSTVDSLTIKVGENTTAVTELKSTTGTLSSSFLGLNTQVGKLEAIIEDEASGIDALNEQADKNTADIATANQAIGLLQSGKVSTETFEALVARVVALEEALAANHPTAVESAE